MTENKGNAVKFMFALVLMCAFSLPLLVSGEETNRDVAAMLDAIRARAEAREEAMKEYIKQMPPVTIYGRVEDQFGHPVEGVEVETQRTEFQPPNRIGPVQVQWITTDQNGAWQITAEKLIDISLHNVRKTGYEFIRPKGQLYYWKYPIKEGVKGTTKDNPAVLALRKKGAETFLIKNQNLRFQFLAKDSGETRGYDFIQKGPIANLAKPILNREPLVCDLQIKAVLNTNDSTWVVTLSPGNTNGGILVSEQLLYEAPAIGYLQEYTCKPEDRKPVKAKYIYLMNRNPPIYTCIELEPFTFDERFLSLDGKFVTNPYGDRNLEEATDVTYEFTRQLTDETLAAFKQNKRPVKPDNLQQMIKEAKEKAAKDKAEREKPPSAHPAP